MHKIFVVTLTFVALIVAVKSYTIYDNNEEVEDDLKITPDYFLNTDEDESMEECAEEDEPLDVETFNEANLSEEVESKNIALERSKRSPEDVPPPQDNIAIGRRRRSLVGIPPRRAKMPVILYRSDVEKLTQSLPQEKLETAGKTMALLLRVLVSEAAGEDDVPSRTKNLDHVLPMNLNPAVQEPVEFIPPYEYEYDGLNYPQMQLSKRSLGGAHPSLHNGVTTVNRPNEGESTHKTQGDLETAETAIFQPAFLRLRKKKAFEECRQKNKEFADYYRANPTRPSSWKCNDYCCYAVAL